MAFIDDSATLQLLTEDFEKLLNENGWDTTGRYRVFSPVEGDTYRKKFGEVTLFNALGSDGQLRNFGMIRGYGVEEPTPLGMEPIISHNSELGILGTGDGTETKFKFKVFPVVEGSESIYFNGVKQPATSFTTDYEKGEVTFSAAPADGVEVSSTYGLTDNAPDTPARLWFFTFEDFRDERVILHGSTEPERVATKQPDGSYKFSLGNNILKNGTVTLFDGSTKVPSENFTVNYDTQTVTFSTNEPTSTTLTADFIMVMVKDSEGNFGDIKVSDFDPHVPESLADACYKGLNYIYPSLPTAVSFITEDDYGVTWTRDSQMYYWGNITKDRIVMYFRPDPAPNPDGTFFAPLYIGKLSTIGKAPRKNNVIIGGCRDEDEIRHTNGMTLGNKLVDYGVNTSNGNSTVMLQQSFGGAYYQKYYLAFITHDVSVDSSAESRFNPSVYSGKYHISPMYIVHPSDGFVGRLDEVYAVHPKNISQLDDLEVIEKSTDEDLGKGDGVQTVFHFFHTPKAGTLSIKVDCGEITTGFTVDNELKTITFDTPPGENAEILATYDYKQVYRYSLADTPNTPFRLANATPFAPIGLGMLKENF